jgi:hypothetical protein
VHFNLEKELMEDWWRRFWWNRLRGEDQWFRRIVLSRLESAVVGFAGDEDRKMMYDELCPTQVLDL